MERTEEMITEEIFYNHANEDGLNLDQF
jgi:hypothetical protein